MNPEPRRHPVLVEYAPYPRVTPTRIKRNALLEGESEASLELAGQRRETIGALFRVRVPPSESAGERDLLTRVSHCEPRGEGGFRLRLAILGQETLLEARRVTPGRGAPRAAGAP